MNASEVLQLIENGENSRVSLKRDNLRPDMLARDIVGMSNSFGGHIIMGVQDDGSISGVELPGLKEWLVNTVFANYVYPPVPLMLEEVEVLAGKYVAIITVSEGLAKPYVVRNTGLEDIYVRTGSVSKLASREESALLFAGGGLVRSELLPALGTNLDDLDLVRLEDYLHNLVGDTVLPEGSEAWVERLCGLGFMVEQGEVCCTIAGLLLFGHAPRQSLPQAGIRWKGFDEDALLHGPLLPLGAASPGGTRRIKELGLLDDLFARIRSFSADYPHEAIQEAVLNAVLHRDWTRGSEVEILKDANRIEITSPGALPNFMTLEKVLAGQRFQRNSIISDVLRDYGYAERPGMGVRRKIVRLTRELTGKDAVFESTDDYFKVIIPAKT